MSIAKKIIKRASILRREHPSWNEKGIIVKSNRDVLKQIHKKAMAGLAKNSRQEELYWPKYM